MMVKRILQNKSGLVLIKNYFFLGSYNAINLVIPLVIAPYLIRTIGIEKYGITAFSQAFMTYFMICTDYGFNLSGPRSASINRDNKTELSRLFSRIMFSKLFLLVLSFAFLFIISMIVPKFRNESLVLFYSFTLVVGQVLQPMWFFQGIEEMKFITILNIIGKAVFTLLTFTLIRGKGDYVYVNALQGIGSILTGVLGILVIIFYYKIKPEWVAFSAIWQELKQGWAIFISSFAVNIYLNANTFILGLFATAAEVGYYSIAEKVMLAIRQLLSVFSQVIYPQVCNMAKESNQMIQRFFRKTFPLMFSFILLICVTAFLAANYITYYMVGAFNENVTLLIRILSFVPPIVACNIPAYQTLLAYDLKKKYSRILIAGALIHIILSTGLSLQFHALGTSSAIIITELFITIGLHKALTAHNPAFSFLNKKKHNV